jgi:hypothetical protein
MRLYPVIEWPVIEWPAPVTRHDTESMQRCQHGCTSHWTAIVRVQDKLCIRRRSAARDTCARKCRRFARLHRVADNLTAPNIENDVRVKINASDETVEIRDIPTPDLVWASGSVTVW